MLGGKEVESMTERSWRKDCVKAVQLRHIFSWCEALLLSERKKKDQVSKG